MPTDVDKAMDQLDAFMEPIKKRWIYHFIVSPKTNLVIKPEWYMNQTLRWIHDDIELVDKKIKLPNVKHKFVLRMVELAVLRLNKDLDKISEDFPILIHTYNEAISFSKVIRQLLGSHYNDIKDEQDILAPFCNQSLFEKIVDAEWDYAEKNLEEITTQQDKWELVLGDQFVDLYKIPRCVDQLLMQIQAISERLECFKEPDCQFKLIELECFLFSRFLTFLKKTNSSNIISDMLFYQKSALNNEIDRRRLDGANFLRLILKERCFIPKMEDLNKSLADKISKLTEDYRDFCYKLEESMQ